MLKKNGATPSVTVTDCLKGSTLKHGEESNENVCKLFKAGDVSGESSGGSEGGKKRENELTGRERRKRRLDLGGGGEEREWRGRWAVVGRASFRLWWAFSEAPQ